jgi:hypothetical protein
MLRRNILTPKYKLAVRQAVRTYEERFSDELYEHLLSKDMCKFWETWSAKSCTKLTSANLIDNERIDKKIAEIFCKRFDENCSVEPQVPNLHLVDDDIHPYLLSIEEVDSAIYKHMKRLVGWLFGCFTAHQHI